MFDRPRPDLSAWRARLAVFEDASRAARDAHHQTGMDRHELARSKAELEGYEQRLADDLKATEDAIAAQRARGRSAPDQEADIARARLVHQEAKQRADAVRRRDELLQHRAAKLSEAQQAISPLVGSGKAWLEKVAAGPLPEPVKWPRVKPASELDLVPIRERLAAIRQERTRIEASPATLAEQHQAIDEAIARAATDWQERNAPPDLARLREAGDLPLIRDVVAPGHDRLTLGMLCHYLPDVVRDDLRARAAADVPANAARLSGPEIRSAVAKLNEQRHLVEVEEEAVIRALAARGLEIARRPDARPEIFLSP